MSESKDLYRSEENPVFECDLLGKGTNCNTPEMISHKAIQILFGSMKPGIIETWAQCEDPVCHRWRFVIPQLKQHLKIDPSFVCARLGIRCIQAQVISDHAIDFILGVKPAKESRRETKKRYRSLMDIYLRLFCGNDYKTEMTRHQVGLAVRSIEQHMRSIGLAKMEKKIGWLQGRIRDQKSPCTVIEHPADGGAGAGQAAPKRRVKRPAERTLEMLLPPKKRAHMHG